MLRASRDEGGQTAVIVALMITAILGFVGLVADIAWYEVGLIRMQRAADAAALAGVVYLPGNVAGAQLAARNESSKNGFTHLTNNVTVNAAPDPANDRQLKVVITGPVRTFFARLFGVNQFNGTRDARAEFILPVPMGSPQDYLGIYQLCSGTGSPPTCTAVHAAPNAASGPILSSQGFWAGVITKGGEHSNGDAYSTNYNGNPTLNTQYDPNGYSYTVEFPAGTTNGEVYIFDPGFCATGNTSVQLGTGDHWIAGGGQPVTTTFKLWDTNGTAYTTDDDTLWINPVGQPCQGCPGSNADSANVFANLTGVDRSAAYRGNSPYNYGAGFDGSGMPDCSSDPYHNNWWRLASGVPAGVYRVQVQTSSSNNNSTNAENMFGIQAKSNGPAGTRVYGATRMCVYNNIDVGFSTFYLAQVAAVHAGKTLEIRLFDPGDVGGNAYLRIKKPTTTGYTDATFSYVASGGGTGTNVTVIQTASGGSLFNNQWVTIQIPLPASYTAPMPPGEPSGQPGWWKIEYQITAAGNDTTTWEVNIRGNPVHLIIP